MLRPGELWPFEWPRSCDRRVRLLFVNRRVLCVLPVADRAIRDIVEKRAAFCSISTELKGVEGKTHREACRGRYLPALPMGSEIRSEGVIKHLTEHVVIGPTPMSRAPQPHHSPILQASGLVVVASPVSLWLGAVDGRRR